MYPVWLPMVPLKAIAGMPSLVLTDVVRGAIALLAIPTDDDVDRVVIKEVKVVVKERKKKKMQKILRP